MDNHDVDRIASKLNITGHIYPVYTLLFTLPGIPSIYYGSEWGIQGKKVGGNDDPLRPAVDLKQALKAVPDPVLLEWIKTLGRIRKEHKAFINGRYQELLLTNRQYAFARLLEEECVLVAVNNDEKEASLSIRLPLQNRSWYDLIHGKALQEDNGYLHIVLAPNESFLAVNR